MGLLRLGALLKYIPRTMTSGFTAAIAVGIFSGQLKGFLGLEMGTVPVKVLEKFEACVQKCWIPFTSRHFPLGFWQW